MKRKVDFTVKGTKLPVVPKGTSYSNNAIHRMDSSKWEVIGCDGNIVNVGNPRSSFFVSFPLPTIESLAEEQGILWVEDEPTTIPPSIEQLLIDCVTLNNTIKRGEHLFDFDESYRLKLLQDCKVKLAAKAAELHNILNPTPLRSTVEIAEEVLNDKL
jgi:hypothetical protein